jgi:hypothetical protein
VVYCTFQSRPSAKRKGIFRDHVPLVHVQRPTGSFHSIMILYKGTGGTLWSGVKHQVGDEGGRQLCSRYPPAKKSRCYWLSNRKVCKPFLGKKQRFCLSWNIYCKVVNFKGESHWSFHPKRITKIYLQIFELQCTSTLSQKPWAISLLTVQCRNHSPYRMKFFIMKDEWFLYFTINIEMALGLCDSV